MELVEVETEVARLDAIFAPVATAPVDMSDPDWMHGVTTALSDLAVSDQAEHVLRAIIDSYATGDDTTRAAIRALFAQYTAFRWAAHLPQDWVTAEDFRAHLIHLSARDQGADTRDEILTLRSLCTQAKEAGIDVAPILVEVAAMSSDVNRYGMGTTAEVILAYGG